MDKCEFSEFQFGFAIAHELITRYRQFTNTIAMPIIPNQRQESFLGFDVLMPFPRATPIALQYKLSQAIRPKELEKFNQKKLLQRGLKLASPCHRFAINEKQNSRLRQLLSAQPLYCAPRFVSFSQLKRLFEDQVVLKHSVLVKPPLNAYKTNHQLYVDLNGQRIFCSEPTSWEEEIAADSVMDAITEEKIDVLTLLKRIHSDLRSKHLVSEVRYQNMLMRFFPWEIEPEVREAFVLYLFARETLAAKLGLDFYLL